MRRIFMISIYIRHKKQKTKNKQNNNNNKTREESLRNLGVIFIGCMIWWYSRVPNKGLDIVIIINNKGVGIIEGSGVGVDGVEKIE